MTKYTTEELLLYIYKEAPDKLTQSIEGSLKTDIELKDKVNSLIHLQKRISKVATSPSQKSIDNILKYATGEVKKNIKL